jgi:hypothetical protein
MINVLKMENNYHISEIICVIVLLGVFFLALNQYLSFFNVKRERDVVFFTSIN